MAGRESKLIDDLTAVDSFTDATSWAVYKSGTFKGTGLQFKTYLGFSSDILAIANGGTASSTESDARTALGLAIGSDVQAHSTVLDATTASFLTADETKLDGIEPAADVTDATNVLAAGAVMTTGVQSVAGAKTFSDAVTVQGAFTSLGIDDNASGERVQVADTTLTIGSSTSASAYTLRRFITDGSMIISGGSTGNLGANFQLFGESHASLANDFLFRSGTTNIFRYDSSATKWFIGGTLQVVDAEIEMGNGGPTWSTGPGSPESAVTADVGSLFTRTDGGASTTLYVKESGTGDTGWVAK